VAAVAALGAVAGAIYLGHRFAEPTVVADPYEEGLAFDRNRHAHEHDAAAVGPRAPPRCEPGRTPCAQRVGGATVTLAVSPRPVAMKDVVFEVTAPADAAGAGPARVALAMPGMFMGENRVVLAPAGAGRWTGKGVFVRCPSGKRGWTAEVELPAAAGRAPLRATFGFEVAE
jgi:hypothetical protein